MPSRAWINPKDFTRGVAYAAPELPKHAPPEWLAEIEEYVSETECQLIFSEHYKNLTTIAWENFAFEYLKASSAAIAERKLQRRIRRNKRAYNYWCGYVMGMKVALEIASRFFKRRRA